MSMFPRPKRAVLTGVVGLILPQNGVLAEAPCSLHYGSSSGRERAPSPSSGGHSGGSDTPKRPKKLLVNGSYVAAATAKHIRENDIEDGGSLPCTPELMSDAELDGGAGGCSAAADGALEADTRQLIVRFLTDFTGLSKAAWNESKALSTMKRVVGDVLEKHRYAYNGMINKLSLDERDDDSKFVGAVAKSLFADGTTNWGRIASLVAFGAVVSQYLKEKGRQNCVETVGHEIATYLLSDQRDWLQKNNSWDGFVEFFRVADPESTVRNTLMAFAGFAGIGATLALLIR